jgi:catechol 2,3-dioxygenase
VSAYHGDRGPGEFYGGILPTVNFTDYAGPEKVVAAIERALSIMGRSPVSHDGLSEVSMTTLGHVVFYVRDLEASVRFYTAAVGLGLCGTIFNGRAALLSGGSTHHELLLIQVGEAPGPLQGKRIGLYHVGWKIGDSIDALQTLYNRLGELGYPVDGLSDHTISQSLYLRDPDGNEIELYVDNPDYDWSSDDGWMEEPVKPLKLGN